ncbi:hypothetical protein [Enterococcus phage 47]|uniref:Uncharacterized protein n=1 Tax=Enterococcus phage PMBT56 TaxID=3229530 RepID=A0AB39C6D5_9CAUD|nr:hypothetical protein [Enterococcus phage vB_EfaS_Ef2.2]QEM41714.1 hypothetical protein [Enterococcus phage vB_EfaS_EF1c55]UOX39237.1 hypothetical protein [Enterococcus phage 47]UQT00839.1 hypothetical protein [Enterococcus phage vB_OCPT_SDS2]UQT01118.1 hypothetical protein LMOIWNZ_00093 [Enterococcus phage vB_OCPT_CCS3]UQT01185.1 hypothetical protein QOFMPA_00062 [Enterococcus phage vB_OCPT_Toy]UQT01554.1 hypothetical protein KMDAMLD_00083 [Enterococcus phage vB_OCPT_PG11]
MPFEESNLEVIVNDLIKDVNTHANQIASIQSDLNRMTTDISSVRDLLIKNTERSDVLIGHIKGQSDEMLKLLTEERRRQTESYLADEASDRKNKEFSQKQMWAVATALVTGVGSALVTIVKLIMS